MSSILYAVFADDSMNIKPLVSARAFPYSKLTFLLHINTFTHALDPTCCQPI